MNVYIVISKHAPAQKHVVIAKSKENAVMTLTFKLNEQKGFDLFVTDDFVAQNLIIPNNYQEGTVIN